VASAIVGARRINTIDTNVTAASFFDALIKIDAMLLHGQIRESWQASAGKGSLGIVALRGVGIQTRIQAFIYVSACLIHGDIVIAGAACACK
jgi:hypothetical protein